MTLSSLDEFLLLDLFLFLLVQLLVFTAVLAVFADEPFLALCAVVE